MPDSQPKSYIFFCLGCTNGFVNVQYNSTTSTVVCDFLDKMDTSIKTCSIKYGQCNPQFLNSTAEANSTLEAPNYIVLYVTQGIIDCYVVKASSGGITILVDGRIPTSTGI